MKRNQLIKKLQTEFPKMWMNLGEEFSTNYKGTIWTGEGSVTDDGLPLFDYYAWDLDPHEKVYTMGVLNRLNKIVEDAGWFVECHDAGTYFIFQNQ